MSATFNPSVLLEVSHFDGSMSKWGMTPKCRSGSPSNTIDGRALWGTCRSADPSIWLGSHFEQVLFGSGVLFATPPSCDGSRARRPPGIRRYRAASGIDGRSPG